MNEKRFTLLEDTNGGLDTVLDTMVKDNGKFLTHKECCDLLNALYEENEQLKQEMGDLGTAHAEEINKIEDEFDEELLKLEKENEQLKQRLELYGEIYPTGKWITELTSEELKKELRLE